MQRGKMRRVIILFLIFSVLILVSAQQDSSDKVDQEVYTALEKNAEVPVIINVNEDSGFIFKTNNTREVKDIVDETERQQGNLIVANVDKNEAEKLEESNAVKRVYYSHSFSASLQDSVRIINATIVWPSQISGINLTGIGESVCVIDTGINFTHPDLLGRNKTCVIDCFGKSCVENCSISDDNGHGTHVAGIVAASSGITGISPGAGLIGLKVLDSSGNSASGGQGEIDIMNAIQWCITNKNNYNISVISMSLGSDTIYSSYCDSKFTLTTSVNNATLYNISVIAAAGNSGSTTNISGPACITNATAVGWTNKNDTINTNSNRNSLVKLMAPGTSINSTFYGGSCPAGFVCNGNYAAVSGTSMATPHVAGAIAIINQFLKLTGQSKTTKEIEAVLNNTGKRIQDTTGLNFSRIDVYSAIISLDNLAPNVFLISPLNNHINLSRNYTFSCNATDLALKNVSFYLWNSSNSAVNLSFLIVSGSFSSVLFNVSNIPYGSYKWNCLFYDENGNFSSASSNFTLTIGGVLASLISPADNNYTSTNFTEFTCQSESAENSLANISFYLWNSSNLVYNETRNISGASNSTIFNYTFSAEDRYKWGCLAFANDSNYYSSGNFSITYDISKPNISLAEPYPSDETSSSASKIFYYNVSDNFNISSCSLIINNAVSLT
ncbi:MAG: S8 family serine peptidase, partial [Nanoarchaeota archaeon]|nr:S8 family serine peptidase [Nanoarchaeota archaeon]